MKKKITTRFMGILLLVLFLSFVALYFVFYTLYIQEQTNMLENTIDLVDLDAFGSKEVQSYLKESDIRMTWIDANGEVVSDTVLNDHHNHLERKEIQQAHRLSLGTDIRYSDTTHIPYLYVAKWIPSSNCYIRLALPLNGLNKSVERTLPLFGAIFIVAILIGYAFISKAAQSLLQPIHKISLKIQNKKDGPIKFDSYAYPELQEITASIEHMDQKIYEQIEAMNVDKRMRQVFFSNASHALKTPLTSIQGYTELLKSEWLSDDQKQDCIKRIHDESLKMATLIQDILMISRLESHERNGKNERFDVQDTIQKIEDRLNVQANEKKIRIVNRTQKTLVYAFKPYIEELILNLLQNAILYNKEGGIITVELGKEHGQMKLKIEDTGIGIERSELSSIFKRFYRIDQNTNNGTGLGLSIVKNIVRYYNGKIEADSTIGIGTSFTILLPILYN